MNAKEIFRETEGAVWEIAKRCKHGNIVVLKIIPKDMPSRWSYDDRTCVECKKEEKEENRKKIPNMPFTTDDYDSQFQDAEL